MYLFSVYDCNYREGTTDSKLLIPMSDTLFDDAGVGAATYSRQLLDSRVHGD